MHLARFVIAAEFTTTSFGELKTDFVRHWNNKVRAERRRPATDVAMPLVACPLLLFRDQIFQRHVTTSVLAA